MKIDIVFSERGCIEQAKQLIGSVAGKKSIKTEPVMKDWIRLDCGEVSDSIREALLKAISRIPGVIRAVEKK